MAVLLKSQQWSQSDSNKNQERSDQSRFHSTVTYSITRLFARRPRGTPPGDRSSTSALFTSDSALSRSHIRVIRRIVCVCGVYVYLFCMWCSDRKTVDLAWSGWSRFILHSSPVRDAAENSRPLNRFERHDSRSSRFKAQLIVYLAVFVRVYPFVFILPVQ